MTECTSEQIIEKSDKLYEYLTTLRNKNTRNCMGILFATIADYIITHAKDKESANKLNGLFNRHVTIEIENRMKEEV